MRVPDKQEAPRSSIHTVSACQKDKKGKRKAVPKPPVARSTKKVAAPAAATKAEPRSAQKRLSILMVASEAHPTRRPEVWPK